MTKKILAAVVAVMMVMALSVTAFANFDLMGEITNPVNAQMPIAIPEGVDVSDGATVTLKMKGTSENTAVRVYLTDANDVGRVTDVSTIEIVDGAFDVTIDLAINFAGGFGGSAAPTHIMFKGPDFSTPPQNVNFEVFEIVSDAAPAAETTPETTAPETTAPETTAPETTAPETTAPETTPDAPKTGLALAVVPAVMALAAVAVSKKH